MDVAVETNENFNPIHGVPIKIDVPQLQERSLPLKFISHKDGPRAAKVMLLNEDNG